MGTLARAFSLATSKIAITFFMVIFLMLLGFAYFPDLLNRLSDFCNQLEGHLRDPNLDDRGKFLFRTLVNENTIFGIIMTLIARSVVELCFWVLGGMWKLANGDPKKKAEKKRNDPEDYPAVEDTYQP